MTASGPTRTATAPDVADHRRERRDHRVRQAALAGFAVLVLLGLTGVLGVRARTITDVGPSGARVDLTYPQVARPALAVPLHLRVSRPGGFTEPIEIRITQAWLDSFDENGVHPEPAETTSDADEVVWTFDPPAGDVLSISIDTRVEPGVEWRRRGTTTVVVGAERVELHHTMWILP